VFVASKPYRPSLLFVGKARAYLSEATFMWSTIIPAPGLAHKQYARLEKLASDKLFSFLQKFVNYARKKFDNIGPFVYFLMEKIKKVLSRGQCYKNTVVIYHGNFNSTFS
jgi:hypothetical protein